MRIVTRFLQGLAFLCLCAALLAAGPAAYAATTAAFNPAGQALDETGGVYSTVAGTGVTITSDISGQWQHSGNDIPGQTGTTLTISPLKVSDQGPYTNGDGTVTLKVYNQVAFAPNPSTQTFAAGSEATFTAAVDTNTGITNDTYSGKWQRSTDGGATWSDVPGGYTGATFTNVLAGAIQTLKVPGTDVNGGDLYRIYAQSSVLDHDFFEGYSYTATLIVQAAPTISTQPAGISVTPGGTSLSMTMNFAPPAGYNQNNYTVQWYRMLGANPAPGDEKLADFTAPVVGYRVSGSSTKTMTFVVPFAADAYQLNGQKYYCVVTDKKYPTLSATTNVAPVDVKIAVSPATGTTTNINIPVGSSTKFDFTAYGGNVATGTLTRKWQKLNTTNSTWEDTTEPGTNWNPDYTSLQTPPIPGSAGSVLQYRCIVSDTASHTTTSNIFRVTLTDALVASPISVAFGAKNITNDLTYQYVQTGTQLTFTATATSKNLPATWTWKLWRSTAATGGTPTLLVTDAVTNSPSGSINYTIPTGETGTYYYYMTVEDGTPEAAANPVPTTTRREIRSAPPIEKPTITTVPAASGGSIAVAPGQNLQLIAVRKGGSGTERVFWFEQPSVGAEIDLGQALSYTKQNIGAADNEAYFYARVERLNDTFVTNVNGASVESDHTASLAVSVSATITPVRNYAEVLVTSPDVNMSTLGAAVPFVVNGLGGTGKYNFAWALTAVRDSSYTTYTDADMTTVTNTDTTSTYDPVTADAQFVASADKVPNPWDWNALLAKALQFGDEGVLLKVTVTVTDQANASNSFVVSADLVLVQNLTAAVVDDTETKSIWQGQETSFTVKAIAGTLNYTNFAWTIAKAGQNGTTISTANVPTPYHGGQFESTWYPNPGPEYSELSVSDTTNLEPGTYTITCTVTDSAPASATSHSLTLIVMSVDDSYLGLSISADPPGTVRPGTDIIFTATPVGGSGDPANDTFTWYYRESSSAGDAAWKSITTGQTVTLPAVPLDYNGYQVFCRVYDSVVRKNADSSNIITLSVVSSDVTPPGGGDGGGSGGGGGGGGGSGSTYDRVERVKMYLTTQ